MAMKVATLATFATMATMLAASGQLASAQTAPTGPTWWNPFTGALSTWLINTSGTVTGYQPVSKSCGGAGGCSNQWLPIGRADITGDGVPDLTWWNPGTGALSTWVLNASGTVQRYQPISAACGAASGCSAQWIPLGFADITGDGVPDLTWWNPSTGKLSTWVLNTSGTVQRYQPIGAACGTAGGCSDQWLPVGFGDMNGDGVPDLMWWNPSTGKLSTWLLTASGALVPAPNSYQLLNTQCGTAGACSNNNVPIGLLDLNGDTHTDLMWWNPGTGVVSIWLLNGSGTRLGSPVALSKGCGSAGACSDNWEPLSTLMNVALSPAPVG
jgi:hypothetical protein